MKIERIKRGYYKEIWVEVSHQNGNSLTDAEADAIMQWTMSNLTGVRMSFQMWKFRSEAELTAFVLRWA